MATIPTAPLLSVRPKVTSQTLEFWWRPPTSDGGDPITSYVLTDGTNFYSTIGNPGYYSITGLTNGQSYSFSLAASNGVGLGPYAFYRTVQPGNKPDPPTNVAYTDQGSGNILVSWTNPANIGGTTNLLGMLVRAYRVTGGNVNLSSFSTVQSILGGVASASYSFPFTSLSSSNDWQFQVQLQNDPGRTLRTFGFTSTFSGITFFSPSSIAGIQMWLDANDTSVFTYSSGNVISQWSDKSGSNNHMYSSGSNIRTADGTVSTVLISTTSFFSTTNLLTINTSTSIHVVVKQNNPSSFATVVKFPPADYNIRFLSSLLMGTPSQTGGAGDFGNNQYFVNGSSNVSTTANTFSTSYGLINAVGTSNIGSTRVSLSEIPGSLNRWLRGNIAEVIMYNGTTAAQVLNRQTVEGYLAWKWGISTLLPSWHPFYYRKPTPSDSNLDFSPSSLGGTQVWLDAADATTIVRSGSTSTITSWTDKSGLSNSATAVNNPQYIPTDNAVYFNNASSQYFTLPNGSLPFGNSSYSYYILLNLSTNTSGSGSFLGGGAAATNQSFNLRAGDTANTIRNYWYNNDIQTTNLYTMNTKVFVGASFSTNSIRYLTLNYQSTVSDTPTARAQVSTNNTLGRTVVNEYFQGRIYEMLVFSTLHGLYDRQKIEGYLAWKWGNQSFLPPSHLYYFRPPTRLDTFTAFSPSTIPGLQVWTDASLFNVADGTSITMFSTMGTSYIGFQGTATVRSNALAGKSVVQILATQAMSTTGASAVTASNFAIFYVGRQFGGSSNNGRVLQGDTNELYGYQAGFKPRWFSTAPGWIVQGNTAANSNWDVWTFGRTSANLTTFNWNGSNQYNATNTPSINGLGFNKGAYTNEASDSQIAEILVFSTSLTPADYARVEGYLAWKWGQQGSLPTTHPFYQASTISLGPLASTIT